MQWWELGDKNSRESRTRSRSNGRLPPPLSLGRARRAQWLQAGDCGSAAEATCHQGGRGEGQSQGKASGEQRNHLSLILCSHWKSGGMGPKDGTCRCTVLDREWWVRSSTRYQHSHSTVNKSSQTPHCHQNRFSNLFLPSQGASLLTPFTELTGGTTCTWHTG